MIFGSLVPKSTLKQKHTKPENKKGRCNLQNGLIHGALSIGPFDKLHRPLR